MKDLDLEATRTEAEMRERTAKVVELTERVYKPSRTIEFNRDGEVLLFSCDNIRNSTIYLKYPYVMYDCVVPLAWYAFWVNPLMWKWQVVTPIFYLAMGFAWMPHALYWKALERKIHKLYLLRGGKSVKICTQNAMGDRFTSWASIHDFRLLTSDYRRFEETAPDFLSREGQLKYEVQVQLDNWVEHFVTVQDELIYFMKEGVVHEPELFERVLQAFNIDTSDFAINTEHNLRHLEPNLNM